uniref:Uncharacterized protein n=1 Tax=Anopheles coluzzii TaxID=1518534 RepID=A0A8W7PB74_ANOCL
METHRPADQPGPEELLPANDFASIVAAAIACHTDQRDPFRGLQIPTPFPGPVERVMVARGWRSGELMLHLLALPLARGFPTQRELVCGLVCRDREDFPVIVTPPRTLHVLWRIRCNVPLSADSSSTPGRSSFPCSNRTDSGS